MYPPQHFRDTLGIMTEEELCAALELKGSTLQYWRRNGTGPNIVRLGKTVYYRRRDVKAWIEACVEVLNPRVSDDTTEVTPAPAPPTGGANGS